MVVADDDELVALGALHSSGHGPEAAERTFIRTMIVAPSATSSGTQL
jgi:hypothetical protein